MLLFQKEGTGNPTVKGRTNNSHNTINFSFLGLFGEVGSGFELVGNTSPTPSLSYPTLIDALLQVLHNYINLL